MTTATKTGASALWIFLLTAASIATTFTLACAMPFAALAALAAVHMHRSDALKLMGLVWLANQFVGFTFLHYPQTLTTYLWGAALGTGAISALFGADIVLARFQSRSEPVRLAVSYLAGFIAFKAVILMWSFGLGGVETTIDPTIVSRQIVREGMILVGLFALYHALRAIGVPAPRPRQSPVAMVTA
jgi:hypothetical protein